MVQKKNSLTFKKQILSVSILALASVIVFPNTINAQEVAALKPTSEWNLKSDANPKTGYCALSRSFDNDVILTIGRNQTEEYSLAVDFQKAKLDPDKAYPVTLQPGPGQIRAYEMMPASARAMVVRLGYDDSFFKTLETSKLLKAEINNIKYNFEIPDINKGQTELNTCLVKIKGDAPVQTAQKFKAEKIEESEKIKKPESDNKPEAKVAAQTDVKKVEPKSIEIKKAEPKPIEIKKADSKPVKTQKAPTEVNTEPVKEQAKIESAKKEAVEIKPVEAKAPKEITIERVAQKTLPVESAPVKAAPVETVSVESAAQTNLVEQESKPAAKAAKAENKITWAAPPVVPNLPDPSLGAPKTETKAVAKVEQPQIIEPAQKIEKVEAKPAEEVQKGAIKKAEPKLQRPVEIARDSRLDSKDVSKKAPVADVANTPQKQAYVAPITAEMQMAPKPFSNEVPKIIVETDAIKPLAEIKNEKIIPQPINAQNTEDKKSVEKVQQASAEAEAINEKRQELAKAVEKQEKRLETLENSDTNNDVEIRNIREELAILRIENKKLYQEAERARANLDTVAIQTGNQALQRIREYERKLEAATADNVALSREIEQMQRLKEDGRLNMVDGDAAMSQTVSRYNEAEREIKRLGLLIEQQRAAHLSEKQELEQMLFDPAVTDQAQRQKLAELERKLAASEQQYLAAQKDLKKREAIVPKEIIKPDPQTELEKQQLAAEKIQLEQELKKVQADLEQSRLALQNKPEPKVIVKPDPTTEQEKQRLAAEALKLEQELKIAKMKAEENKKLQDDLKVVQDQLLKTQIALRDKEMQKPVVTAPDPMAQRNNIQIEQLNKKLDMQSKQMEIYQRQIAAEKQQKESLKIQAEMAAEKAAELAMQKAQAQAQAQAQARIAAQAQIKAQADAAIEAQKLASTQPSASAAGQISSSAIAPSINTPSYAPPTMTANSANKTSFSANDIRDLLQRGNVNPNAGVDKTGANEFQWNVGEVRGLARVAHISQTPNMNSFVQGFVANMKQSCAGDFASLPSQDGGQNNFEIACIGGMTNTSSSVVFLQKDDHYIAISHITTPENMDMAMDARDRIAGQL